MRWAWMYAPKAPDCRRGPNLMLSRSERTIDAASQEVLFYLYAADLARAARRSYPDYLPGGECRVADPDGYTLMIAQAAADTP